MTERHTTRSDGAEVWEPAAPQQPAERPAELPGWNWTGDRYTHPSGAFVGRSLIDGLWWAYSRDRNTTRGTAAEACAVALGYEVRVPGGAERAGGPWGWYGPRGAETVDSVTGFPSAEAAALDALRHAAAQPDRAPAPSAAAAPVLRPGWRELPGGEGGGPAFTCRRDDVLATGVVYWGKLDNGWRVYGTLDSGRLDAAMRRAEELCPEADRAPAEAVPAVEPPAAPAPCRHCGGTGMHGTAPCTRCHGDGNEPASPAPTAGAEPEGRPELCAWCASGEECIDICHTKRYWYDRGARDLEAVRAQLDAAREVIRQLGDAGAAEASVRQQAEAERDGLLRALTTIERTGAPGATILAQRSDGHACGWCRGVYTPCPVSVARNALSKSDGAGEDGR